MTFKAKPPVLKTTDRLLPGFLWYLWARASKQRLQGVRVVDSVMMTNGRIKAWVFYSTKAQRILCKKTQNITAQGIHDTFCRGRKSYDCVATFSSPHRPAHLPPHPNWIADGVAMKRVTASNYVQYLSPKGLQTFLNMSEKHSEEDKAWELKLSKKYNDLAGSRTQAGAAALDDAARADVIWDAAYADQNTPHAFTGVLQRFDAPLGDTNHEIYSIWNDGVHLCERRSSKYKLSDPGIDMIHKLDLQGLSEGTMVAEDLAGSPIETEVHRLSDAIRAHACAVANGLRLKKCVLAFRMTTDIRPLFLGCVALQPEEVAFKLKSRVSHVEAAPLTGIGARSRKLSRLMSAAPSATEEEGAGEDEVQEALNHDGTTFTCAVTGETRPLADAHSVTLKQLLALHKLEQQEAMCGGRDLGRAQAAVEASTRVPLFIRRALPGIRAREYSSMIKHPLFVLTRAFVCEHVAVRLLRTALEAFHGPTEAERIRERYRIRREIEELRRLGLTIWRPEELLGPGAASVSSSSAGEASCTSADASRDGSVAVERIGTHVSFQPQAERALPWAAGGGGGGGDAAVSPRLLVVEESPRGDEHGDVALGALRAHPPPGAAVAPAGVPAVPSFLAPAPGTMKFHGRGRRTRSAGAPVLRADLAAKEQAARRASRQQHSAGKLTAPPRGLSLGPRAKQQFGTRDARAPRKQRASAAVAQSPRAASADAATRAMGPAPCAEPSRQGGGGATDAPPPESSIAKASAQDAAPSEAADPQAAPAQESVESRMSLESQRLIDRAEAVLSQSRSLQAERATGST